MKPSDDPKADKLVNSNISQPNEGQDTQDSEEEDNADYQEQQ